MYSTLTKLWCINTTAGCFLLFVAMHQAPAFAQVRQTDRFEFPIANERGLFDVVPASDKGLFLYRRMTSSKGDQLHLIKLDTSFSEKWSGFLPVDRNYNIMGKRGFQKKLFLLLRYRDYSRNDMLLTTIDEADGRFIQHNIKSFIPFSPTEFQVTEKAVLIGGYYNRIPVVIHFSLVSYKSKVLPGLFSEIGELTQIKTYPDGSFDVLISARNFSAQRTLWIKNYDAEGNLYRNFPLSPEENKHLIFGRSLKVEGDVQLVAGVYGTRSSEYSRGVFITSIEPSGLEQMRYYNFADLENFFKYMKARREQRIKERIERRKIKGKKIRFNYRFLVHELVKYKDQYVLLGEAFYPRYRSVDRSHYGGFFNPMVPLRGNLGQNGRIFDGYYYTHAVVMGFDENGKLLWDNSFEINDVKTFTLDQFVKLEVLPDRIALMYLFENHIRTKIIQDDLVLEGKTVDPIATFNGNEMVKDEKNDLNKLEYWYSHYLYAYGVQDVVSRAAAGGQKRKVFFINKVYYDQ